MYKAANVDTYRLIYAARVHTCDAMIVMHDYSSTCDNSNGPLCVSAYTCFSRSLSCVIMSLAPKTNDQLLPNGCAHCFTAVPFGARAAVQPWEKSTNIPHVQNIVFVCMQGAHGLSRMVSRGFVVIVFGKFVLFVSPIFGVFL